MKVNQIKTKTLNASTALLLDAAITAWIVTQDEATFLSIDYSENAGNYSVLITYTL